MITFLISVFPSNYILDVYGLKVATLIGAGGTCLGACIRVGAYDNFWYVLVGNFIGGIVQPLLINAPAKLACTWFRPEMVKSNQRPTATTLAAICNPVGIAFGFGIPSFFVTGGGSKKDIGLLMAV